MSVPLWTAAEARAFDRWAETELGVSGLVLMENAGRAAADHIEARAPCSADFLIAAGPGQNGGDGYVLARQLWTRGRRVHVWPFGEPGGDGGVNLRAWQNIVERSDRASMGEGPTSLANLVFIDALFGTGLSRNVEGSLADCLARASEARMRVALDVPSGVDATTGALWGAAFCADLTVSFGSPKCGLFLGEGAKRAGEIVIADLGVRVRDEAPRLLLERSDLCVPARPRDAHKGRARICVLAGSSGTSGAALLAGRAALRAGAGLVHVRSRANLDSRVVELMAEQVDTSADACAELERMHVGVVGPGLGRDELGASMARAFVASFPAGRPIVIDADALHAYTGVLGELRAREANSVVLTPHPGEAAALLETSTGEVQRDRLGAAASLRAKTGQIVVLKGARTIVAATKTFVCPFGGPSLAVGGSGDVLAGVLAALLVDAPSTTEGACMAVLAHALAGEAVGRGTLASEIAGAVPRVIEASAT